MVSVCRTVAFEWQSNDQGESLMRMRANGNPLLTRVVAIIGTLSILLSVCAFPGTVHAQGFNLGSASSNWSPTLVGAKFDPGQDTQATAAIDLVGNAANPLMYMNYDDNGTGSDQTDDELSLRFRVDNARDSQDAYAGYLWIGMDVDLDGDLDVFLMLERTPQKDYVLDVYSAGTGANNSPSTSSIASPVRLATLVEGTTYRIDTVTSIDGSPNSVDGDADVDDFVSVRFSFQDFANIANLKPLTLNGGALIGSIGQGAGLTKNTPLRYVVASAQQTNSLNGDMAGYNDTDDQSVTFEDQGAFSPTVTLADPDTPVTPTPTLASMTLAGPASVVAGQTSESFTLTLIGSDGQPFAVGTDTTFSLNSNSDGTVTFTPASVTVPTGQSSATFTYTDTKAGDWTVTASGNSLTPATHAITVTPGAPAKLVFTTAPQTITAGDTSGLITLQLQDAYGNPATSGSDTTIALSSDGAVTFVDATSDQVTVPAGQSTVSFRATATTGGVYAITAAGTGLTSATQDLTVQWNAPVTIQLQNPTPVITLGEKTGPITVTLRDAYGNLTAGTVTLSSATGATFRDAGDTTDITQVTITGDPLNATFLATAATAGSHTLTATSGQASTSTSLMVSDPSPTLAGVTLIGPASVVAGQTSESFTLTLIGSDDLPFASVGLTAFTLTSDSGGSVTLPATVTVGDGESSVTFTYTDTMAGTWEIAATGDPGTAKHQIDVTADVPAKLVFTTAPQTIIAGDTSGLITLQLQDAYGNPATSGGETTIDLSAVGVTFRDDADSMSITQVTVPTGQSTVSFRATATTGGAHTITTASTGLTGATQDLTVQVVPHHIALSGLAEVTAGVPVELTLTVLDINGDPIALSEAATFGASTSESEPVTTFSPTAVAVAKDASSATFTYTDTKAGDKTITASDEVGTLGSATHALKVKPGSPASIHFITAPDDPTEPTDPVTIAAGDTSGLITLQLRDAYGNVATSTSDTTISLSSDNAITFLDVTGDQVIIPAGQSTATFRVTTSKPGEYQLAAQSDGLTGDQRGLSVTPVPVGITLSGPDSAQAGQAVQLTLTVVDANGAAVKVAGETSFTLTASDEANASFDPVTVTVAAVTDRATFTYTDTAAGAKTVTATDEAETLGSATHAITVNPGAPASLAFTTDPQTITAGQTSGPITLELLDAYGNAPGGTITLSIDSAVSFVDLTGGAITIPGGTSTGSFQVRSSTAGTYTLTASIGALTASQTLTVQSAYVPPAPAPVPTGTLAATVTTDFGMPASGIPYEVRNAAGEVVASGVTDSQGRIDASLPAGDYTIRLDIPGQPVTGGAVITGGNTTTVALTVPSTLTLNLTSDPASIVGDGKSTATLLAQLRTLDGAPAPGVTVQLSATAGTLSSGSAQSNAQGQATAVLTAPQLDGTQPRTEQITATVYDPARGLFARANITIRFLPATVAGVVIDSATGKPVAGARISVAEDFDSNGTIDFEASYVTGADGRYEIVVPRGGWRYTVKIQTPVVVGGETVWVTSTQHGDVDQLQGTGEEHLASPTMSGLLLMKDGADQQPKTLDQVLPPGASIQASVRDANGQPLEQQVSISPEGVFQVEGIPPGTYRIVFQVTAPNGVTLAGTSLTITVNGDGELALQTGLIDPYGVVTDSTTGKPVAGVTMKLYWADTPENIAAGRTPHTLVNLPELPDFPPGANRVPQVTNAAGEYAWMVFPDGWYYIVAEKDGYQTYDSRVEGRNRPAGPGEDSFIQDGLIYVGSAIVEYSLSLEPIAGGTGSTVNPDPVDDPGPTPVDDTQAAQEGTHLRYIQGYPDGLFRPEQSITRAEVATILTRITGPITAADDVALYPDVAGDHWAARYIKAAKARGLMIGDPDGRFRPQDPISRAEVAVIALRFKQLQLMSGSAFPDTPGHWADSTIYTVTQAGLITGYPDGTYRPTQPITRAEFVTVINRLLERGPLTGLPAPTFPDVTPSHWAYGQVEEAGTSHRYRRMPGYEEWIEMVPHPVW